MYRLPIFIVAIASLMANAPSRADNFRMESAIFAQDNAAPQYRVVTRFLGNRIYDEQVGDVQECCVVDLDSGTCTLLDLKRKRWTEVSFQQVANFAALATHEARDSVPFVRFAAFPKFVENVEPQNRRDHTYWRVDQLPGPNDTRTVKRLPRGLSCLRRLVRPIEHHAIWPAPRITPQTE